VTYRDITSNHRKASVLLYYGPEFSRPGFIKPKIWGLLLVTGVEG
jgi:hypothetical protein